MEGKLVRDRIPEILERKGIKFSVEVLGNERFVEELLKKLSEEGGELERAVNSGDRVNVIEELADVREVIYAIAEALGVHSLMEADREFFRKREEKGGFEKRIFLTILSDEKVN
jgi:predicted house-cleaning noncanonical NTP pyrophosphatase (MazG superfamily)